MKGESRNEWHPHPTAGHGHHRGQYAGDAVWRLCAQQQHGGSHVQGAGQSDGAVRLGVQKQKRSQPVHADDRAAAHDARRIKGHAAGAVRGHENRRASDENAFEAVPGVGHHIR